MQEAFNRGVIKPHDGHTLCDPYPAICGFRLRISWSRRIANSTIMRPKETLIVVINALLLGDFRIEGSAPDGDGAFGFATFHVLIAIQPPKVFP
jgi:hypothetical protein